LLSLAGLLYGCCVHSCYLVHDYTLAEVTRHAIDVFLQGICTSSPPAKEGALR
jgi:hypothetical protein